MKKEYLMSVVRSKTFVELVAQRTPANARNDLEVYSKVEVDGQISTIDLTPYATDTEVASISGSLDTRIDALEVSVQDISAALNIDINNVDLSLTQKISEECMLSEGISGAATTVSGHIIVTVNGVEYKLATVA